MISTTELASIQSDVTALACNLPCQIQRKIATPDGIGTDIESWVTISSNGLMAGMSQPSGGLLANYSFIIGDLAAWTVRIPIGTDVREQDRLIVGGQTLIVQVVLAPRSYEVLHSVIASEVK